tara:strand:+ start:186 stop:425 length:240 start_codon:yes stop_codon:yes gene_type:complete
VTTPEFFDQLEEGEEYLSLLCTKQTYACINPLVTGQLVISSVRQKNESFREDEQHKLFIKALRKAKKDLQNYEYNKNNI